MNESKQIALVIIVTSQIVQIDNTLLQMNGYNLHLKTFTPLALLLLAGIILVIEMIKRTRDESK